MLHITWEPTTGPPRKKADWMSPWVDGVELPHILGPIAVSFRTYKREILVEDSSKLEPNFDEKLEAEDLCHGTK